MEMISYSTMNAEFHSNLLIIMHKNTAIQQLQSENVKQRSCPIAREKVIISKVQTAKH